MHLKNFEEIIGTLTIIDTDENNINLTFSIERKIMIPKEETLEKKLDKLLGKKIAIFNDGSGFRTREINDKQESTA